MLKMYYSQQKSINFDNFIGQVSTAGLWNFKSTILVLIKHMQIGEAHSKLDPYINYRNWICCLELDHVLFKGFIGEP